MAAVLTCFRSDLRARWRAWAALVVLLGLAGGVALASVAAARRTASAYPRFLAAGRASDLTIDLPPGDASEVELSALVDGLPQVEHSGLSAGLLAAANGREGRPDFEAISQVLTSVDGRFFDTDRVAVVEGRLPDPARPDEAMMNVALADTGRWDVGDEVELVITTVADVMAVEGTQRLPLFDTVMLRIVGTVVQNEEVLQDDLARQSRLITTPAFFAAHGDSATYLRQGVKLRRGRADVATVQDAVQRMAADPEIVGEQPEGDGTAASFEVIGDVVNRAQRALRPQVAALGVFAALAAVVALLVVGQALARDLASTGAVTEVRSALGMTRRELAMAAVLPSALVAGGGAVLAVGTAIALSPLGPVGAVRAVEPDPGVHVDATVLAVGVGVIVLVVLAVGSVSGARVARRSATGSARQRTPAASAASGVGLPPPAVAGIGFGLDSGSGRRAVPVRATLAGATLAVGAVMCALCFGASLDRLVDTPRLHGWSFDFLLSESGGYGDATTEQGRMISSIPGVATVAQLSYDSVAIDGAEVAALGVTEVLGRWTPPMLEGRPASGPGEVVLGTNTLRRIRKDVGDVVHVSAGGHRARMRVVGRAAFPAVGRVDGSRTGLGDGAAMTAEGLARVAELARPNETVVELSPDADRRQVRHRLERAFVASAGDPTLGRAVLDVQRPAAIVSADAARATPLALAGMLSLVALATVAHLLFSSTRVRQRELALLKTLGFSRRQLRSTVAWQATSVVAVALVVGVPLGVAAGRTVWRAFAAEIGAVALPEIPIVALVAVVAGTVIAGNALAALPGRRAAAVSATTVLRSE